MRQSLGNYYFKNYKGYTYPPLTVELRKNLDEVELDRAVGFYGVQEDSTVTFT